MKEKAEQEIFAEQAPKLTDGETEAVNGLFRAFIFRRRKTGEYWTTCCREHVVLDQQRTVTSEMNELMDREHAPEPKYTWGCHSGWALRSERSEERVTCPHCGAKATIKEIGSTGCRGNLTSWRRAVVLKWDGEALWAVGYSAKKSYEAPAGPLTQLDRLTAQPELRKVAVLRFNPGSAEMTTRDWWYASSAWSGMTVQTEPRKNGLPFPAGDPFTWCRDYGKGYDMVGWDELDSSPFRYVRIREICDKTGTEPLRLLAMACFYANQMEMLHKFGLDRVIERFADQGVKTAWLFDWAAKDRKKFAKLPVKTILEAIGADPAKAKNGVLRPGPDVDVNLEALKAWKVRKGRDSLADCRWEVEEMGNKAQRDRVRARLNAFGVSFKRTRNYLQNQQRPHQSVSGVEQLWTDYLDAAEHLGLDMASDVIRFPKDLLAAHDARCGEWAEVLRVRREIEEARKKAETAKVCATRKKRYEFAADGLRIIVPEDPDEIIQEGRNLRHCVGGYAGRHAEGKTTILFLRKEAEPDKSLVTIEITGTTIRQAHGWKNEMEACPENPKQIAPTTLYKNLFDQWLDWLKRGSPRDKQGNPIIKEKKTGANRAPQQNERKAG